MALQKEFFVLCPDCHKTFLTTREKVHKPVILYDQVTWTSPPDSTLGELNRVFEPDSPLIADLFTHHKSVGHHLLHNIYVLFQDKIDLDCLLTALNQDDLQLRYPDSMGLLYAGTGGQIILWKMPDNVREVDTMDFGS